MKIDALRAEVERLRADRDEAHRDARALAMGVDRLMHIPGAVNRGFSMSMIELTIVHKYGGESHPTMPSRFDDRAQRAVYQANLAALAARKGGRHD